MADLPRSYSFEDSHNERYQDSPQRSPERFPWASIPEQYHIQGTSSPAKQVLHERSRSRYDGSIELTPTVTTNFQHSPTPPPPPPPVHAYLPPTAQPVDNMHQYDSYEMDSGGGYGAREDAAHSPYQNTNQATPPTMMGHDQDFPHNHKVSQQRPQIAEALHYRDSYGSNLPLTAEAATPGAATPHTYSSDARSSRLSLRSMQQPHYIGQTRNESPYQHSGVASRTHLADENINAHDIVDDEDNGFTSRPPRQTGIPMSRPCSREDMNHDRSPTRARISGVGVLSGLFGRKQKGVSTSGSYTQAPQAEKSEWPSRNSRGLKKHRWVVGTVIIVVVILAVIGGIVGGVVGSQSHSAVSDTNNADTDTSTNGDLSISSPQIVALMNNKNLHKVFPGIDYTPWGTQYPLCLTYPPSQNNVTRDMAVLSQLTNSVRLYGTDCNQTEMVLHAISQLKLNDMKVWLGVWIDTNATTTERQLSQMYKILKEVPDHNIFKGTIIGNEALYRAGEDKSQSEQELIDILTSVRSNFTSLGYNLSVSTSDLGDNWNGQLVTASDYVMSNIHPFFAGTVADQAAAWTYEFWQGHDVPLTVGTNVKQMISETGWPSGGGTDCGNDANVCATGDVGSVASVANMNTFMNDWVCQALENGTNYLWFEAFDEPWKVVYNTPGKEWEDKWGLMDPARNLKPGLVIPSCGGKTVS